MHLILTGATGLVGSGVLDAMIKMKDVSRISIISRRPVKMADDAKDPRINVILHKDFAKYDKDLLEQVKGASGCVWALGISQNSVNKEDYIKITKTFALAAADAFQHLPSDSEPFNFVYVSGDGTTLKPGTFTPLFGRVKGETEVALADMRKANPLFHVNTMRPSLVDASAHDAIRHYIPVQSVAVRAAAAVLGPIVRTAVKSKMSPTEPMGRFLTEMATGKWEGKFTGEKIGDFAVVENPEFRKLAGLDS